MANNRLIFSTLICFTLSYIALGADSIDPQLQREILAGWAELEKNDNARTAIDSTWTRDELEGPNKGRRSEVVRYRRNGESARISFESGKTDEILVNSRYVSSVSRESHTHPWTLRFVELDLAGENAKGVQVESFLAKLVAPTSAVLLGSAQSQQKKPSSLMDDPKFKMTRVERLADGLVRMHYQYELLVGEFDCDPAAHYVIRKGRSREKGQRLEYSMTHERHFIPVGADGRVVVERLVSEVVSNPIDLAGHWKDETAYSYPDVRRTGELDEERFRLTAYGLPEPMGVEWPKRTSRWWWLVGAAFAALILAVLFRHLHRRSVAASLAKRGHNATQHPL